MKTVTNLVSVLCVCLIVGIGSFYWTDVHANEAMRRISTDAKTCLAKNIFFEARNQSIEGQVAVAWVTLNRVASDAYPNTICEVVHQARYDSRGNPIKNKCQFSWYCDGKSDRIPNNVVAQRAWEDAQLIADVVLLDWVRAAASPVKGATMYHATYVKPYWRKAFAEVARVDDHIFYE